MEIWRRVTRWLDKADIGTFSNARVNTTVMKSHWFSTGFDHFSCSPTLGCHSRKWPREGSRYQEMERKAYYGLAERVLAFLPWDTVTGTLFIVPPQHNCTMSSPFSFTTLCHILGISPFRRPTTWFSFGAENSSSCLMQSSREWKFLSIKKNSETRTKWPWERAQYLSTMEEPGLHSQAGNVFPGHQREMCSLT